MKTSMTPANDQPLLSRATLSASTAGKIKVPILSLGMRHRKNGESRRSLGFAGYVGLATCLVSVCCLFHGCAKSPVDVPTNEPAKPNGVNALAEQGRTDMWTRYGEYPDAESSRVNALAVDPANPSVLYAALNLPVLSVLRLTETSSGVAAEMYRGPTSVSIYVPSGLPGLGGEEILAQYSDVEALCLDTARTLYAAKDGLMRWSAKNGQWEHVIKTPGVLSDRKSVV